MYVRLSLYQMPIPHPQVVEAQFQRFLKDHENDVEARIEEDIAALRNEYQVLWVETVRNRRVHYIEKKKAPSHERGSERSERANE